jgi:hypothetical protein
MIGHIFFPERNNMKTEIDKKKEKKEKKRKGKRELHAPPSVTLVTPPARPRRNVSSATKEGEILTPMEVTGTARAR